MSLILEALRKLEREKGAPEDRGLVVVGSGGGGGRRPAGRSALAVLAAVAIGALGAMAWQRLGPPASPPEPQEATTPAPALEAVPAPRRPAPLPAPELGPGGSSGGSPSTDALPEAAAVPGGAARPPATPVPALRLQAITRRDGHPVALVNERLVREGDSFDGIRVVRIGETEVELETPDGSVVLRF